MSSGASTEWFIYQGTSTRLCVHTNTQGKSLRGSCRAREGDHWCSSDALLAGRRTKNGHSSRADGNGAGPSALGGKNGAARGWTRSHQGEGPPQPLVSAPPLPSIRGLPGRSVASLRWVGAAALAGCGSSAILAGLRGARLQFSRQGGARTYARGISTGVVACGVAFASAKTRPVCNPSRSRTRRCRRAW